MIKYQWSKSLGWMYYHELEDYWAETNIANIPKNYEDGKIALRVYYAKQGRTPEFVEERLS